MEKNTANNVEVVKNRRTGGYDVIVGDRVIARNVIASSVNSNSDFGIIFGKYDVPIGLDHDVNSYPSHLFIYSESTEKLYNYKKEAVFTSDFYDYPLFIEDNQLKRFVIKDSMGVWESICTLNKGQRVYRNNDYMIQIESKYTSEGFDIPFYLDKKLVKHDVSKEELRKIIWRHIYYGLSDGKASDDMLTDLAIPEVDTLDHVRGFIKSLEKAKFKGPLRNKDSTDYDNADIDELIKAIDRKIEELEKGEGMEVLDESDYPMISEITDNYSLYSFCKMEKLSDFTKFTFIIEDKLGLKSDTNITYLLLRMLNASRKYYSRKFEKCYFPDMEFNDLLSMRLLMEGKSTRLGKKFIRDKICSPVSDEKPVELLFLEKFFAEITYESPKKNRFVSMESKGKRIGWIEYSVSENKERVLYQEAIAFGNFKPPSELHSTISRDDEVFLNDKDHRYAEVFYDLSDRKLHVVNNEQIPLKNLMQAMVKLEDSDVDYVIDDYYSDTDYSETDGLLSEHKSFFTCNINDSSEIEKYKPLYEGIRYGGFAALKGDTLCVSRFRIDSIKTFAEVIRLGNEYAFRNEERFFMVRTSPIGESKVLVSEEFDMSVISVLIDLFGIKDEWKWRRYLSEERTIYAKKYSAS